MSIIRQKHDRFFRKAMENPIVAREFFDAHLPDHVKALIDPETLKIEKDSFIEEDLKNSISDILFSVQLHKTGSIGYIYLLLEHQSTSDRFMAFRLLKYTVNIYTRHLTLQPDSKYLPLVYPAVFFHGKESYSSPRNLWSLFENNNLAKEIWSNDYNLINVNEISDEELKKRAWSGILEFFLKHTHERELFKRWQEVADLLPEFMKVTIGYEYLEIVLSYTLTKIKQGDKIELEKLLESKLNPETGKRLMKSLARHWEEEGKAKGIAEGKAKGKREIAKKMLSQNYSLSDISNLTGLPIEEISRLRSH